MHRYYISFSLMELGRFVTESSNLRFGSWARFSNMRSVLRNCMFCVMLTTFRAKENWPSVIELYSALLWFLFNGDKFCFSCHFFASSFKNKITRFCTGFPTFCLKSESAKSKFYPHLLPKDLPLSPCGILEVNERYLKFS